MWLAWLAVIVLGALHWRRLAHKERLERSSLRLGLLAGTVDGPHRRPKWKI